MTNWYTGMQSLCGVHVFVCSYNNELQKFVSIHHLKITLIQIQIMIILFILSQTSIFKACVLSKAVREFVSYLPHTAAGHNTPITCTYHRATRWTGGRLCGDTPCWHPGALVLPEHLPCISGQLIVLPHLGPTCQSPKIIVTLFTIFEQSIKYFHAWRRCRCNLTNI